MQKMFLLLLVFLISGCCSVEPVFMDDGQTMTMTYRHGKALTKVVKADAEKQCDEMGMYAKYERTDCSKENCTSTFSCFGNPQGKETESE